MPLKGRYALDVQSRKPTCTLYMSFVDCREGSSLQQHTLSDRPDDIRSRSYHCTRLRWLDPHERLLRCGSHTLSSRSEHPGGLRKKVEAGKRRHRQRVACERCGWTGEGADEVLQGDQREWAFNRQPHSCCHRRLKQMCQRRMRRDGVMSTVEMHCVLHYDNDDCRSMTMIRDVYA